RSRRLTRNASNRSAQLDADAGPKNPIRAIFAGCCAWAANGHVATEPLRSVMNSRRLIATPEAQDRASYRLKTSTSEGAMSALGQKQTFFRCETYVRFTPESGHWQCTSACRLWANSGHPLYLEDAFK